MLWLASTQRNATWRRRRRRRRRASLQRLIEISERSPKFSNVAAVGSFGGRPSSDAEAPRRRCRIREERRKSRFARHRNRRARARGRLFAFVALLCGQPTASGAAVACFRTVLRSARLRASRLLAYCRRASASRWRDSPKGANAVCRLEFSLESRRSQRTARLIRVLKWRLAAQKLVFELANEMFKFSSSLAHSIERRMHFVGAKVVKQKLLLRPYFRHAICQAYASKLSLATFNLASFLSLDALWPCDALKKCARARSDSGGTRKLASGPACPLALAKWSGCVFMFINVASLGCLQLCAQTMKSLRAKKRAAIFSTASPRLKCRP